MDERIKTALEIIAECGGCDGGHHKQWVLDQVVRILTNCPTIQKTKTDCNGKEYTFDVLGESDEYHEWIRVYCAGEDGPCTYSWEIGIPP